MKHSTTAEHKMLNILLARSHPLTPGFLPPFAASAAHIKTERLTTCGKPALSWDT